MLLKPLTVAAGLLAVPATRAFLVPPEVSDADIEIANTIESVGAQVADSQLVNIECPGCPISVQGKHGKNIELQIDRPSHLELTFSIDHLPSHDRLLVNGFELYPLSDPMHETLFAPQVVDRREKDKRHHREHDRPDGEHHKRPHHLAPQPQRLGFGLNIGPSKKDSDGQFELVEVELQIIEVGVAFRDDIPSVKVKLIKDDKDRLLMSQIEKVERKFLQHPEDECTTLLCKWLAMAREKVKGFKGFGHCHGMKGGMNRHGAGEAPHGHPHPHPHHPHDPAAGHWPPPPYQERRWGKLFKYIAAHILLPVLIGIVAGVSVSLIGMAVGTVIVSFWRIFFRRRSGHRRHHSGHAHHKAARKEAAVSEEKSGLIEHQDPPPSYEEQETEKTSQV
jgi:hypothetical protein